MILVCGTSGSATCCFREVVQLTNRSTRFLTTFSLSFLKSTVRNVLSWLPSIVTIVSCCWLSWFGCCFVVRMKVFCCGWCCFAVSTTTGIFQSEKKHLAKAEPTARTYLQSTYVQKNSTLFLCGLFYWRLPKRYKLNFGTVCVRYRQQ